MKKNKIIISVVCIGIIFVLLFSLYYNNFMLHTPLVVDMRSYHQFENGPQVVITTDRNMYDISQSSESIYDIQNNRFDKKAYPKVKISQKDFKEIKKHLKFLVKNAYKGKDYSYSDLNIGYPVIYDHISYTEGEIIGYDEKFFFPIFEIIDKYSGKYTKQ